MRTLLILARASNLPTVWTNVIAAWFLSGGTWSQELLWTCLAGSLVYIGGMTLNDAFDARWDKQHGKDRPIPRGDIDAGTVWLTGSIWMISGAVLMVLLGAAWWALASLVICILLYNAIHKKWSGSIWLMGGCRLLLYGTAGSVAAEVIPAPVIYWGGAMLFYIAGITLAARGEDTGGAVKGVSMVLLALPAVVAVGMIKLMPAETGEINLPLSLGVILMFVSWLLITRRKLPKIGPFVGGLLAGIVLVDALAVSSTDYLAAAVCAAFLPVNLLFQRFIPAT